MSNHETGSTNPSQLDQLQITGPTRDKVVYPSQTDIDAGRNVPTGKPHDRGRFGSKLLTRLFGFGLPIIGGTGLVTACGDNPQPQASTATVEVGARADQTPTLHGQTETPRLENTLTPDNNQNKKDVAQFTGLPPEKITIDSVVSVTSLDGSNRQTVLENLVPLITDTYPDLEKNEALLAEMKNQLFVLLNTIPHFDLINATAGNPPKKALIVRATDDKMYTACRVVFVPGSEKEGGVVVLQDPSGNETYVIKVGNTYKVVANASRGTKIPVLMKTATPVGVSKETTPSEQSYVTENRKAYQEVQKNIDNFEKNVTTEQLQKFARENAYIHYLSGTDAAKTGPIVRAPVDGIKYSYEFEGYPQDLGLIETIYHTGDVPSDTAVQGINLGVLELKGKDGMKFGILFLGCLVGDEKVVIPVAGASDAEPEDPRFAQFSALKTSLNLVVKPQGDRLAYANDNMKLMSPGEITKILRSNVGKLVSVKVGHALTPDSLVSAITQKLPFLAEKQENGSMELPISLRQKIVDEYTYQEGLQKILNKKVLSFAVRNSLGIANFPGTSVSGVLSRFADADQDYFKKLEEVIDKAQEDISYGFTIPGMTDIRIVSNAKFPN